MNPGTLAFTALLLGASLLAISADVKPPGSGGGKDGQRKGGKGRDVPMEDLASLPIYLIAGSAYFVALLTIQVLVPKLTPAVI